MSAKRPRTIREVAERALSGEDFDMLVREFMDSFYMADEKEPLLRDAPERLPDPRHDAFLAAMSIHLSQEYGIDEPSWALDSGLMLDDPWFPSGLDGARMLLVIESPPAFKAFNIFPGKLPLFRPLKLLDRRKHGSRYMPEGV